MKGGRHARHDCTVVRSPRADQGGGRLTGAALQRLLENPDRYEPNFGRFGRLYPLMVNYDLDVDRLVCDNRFNGYVNGDVNSAHFPAERRGNRDAVAELYEFDETVIGEDAARRIEEDGYVNEDAHALLTFGKEHPIEQLRRLIVALGRRWQDRGRVFVPGLGRDGGRRALDLSRLGDEFHPCCRFLVSRKSA